MEDRGYQFGDGIYEVLYAYRGRLMDSAAHFARLERSLRAIELPAPMGAAALMVVIREVLRRNRVSTGLVYMQITRGVAPRDHAFPAAGTRPGLVITARAKPEPPADAEGWAVAVVTAPDERWGRCDIKSINLLPNVLAKQAARAAGAYEAVLYDDDGMVTEGAASTVWMVDADGVLRTRFLDAQVLPGCTRAALLARLAADGVQVKEAAFSRAELRAAREIFLTSATSFVRPVTRLDGAPVGNGAPGILTTHLLEKMVAGMNV